jgi:hypothetical protein
MKDRFEIYIEENRNEFDLKSPSPLIWDRIQKKMATHKKRPVKYMFQLARTATAIILLLAFSIAIILTISKYSPDNKNTPSPRSGIHTNGNLSDAIFQYNQSIQVKLKELKSNKSRNTKYYDTFIKDLNRMDSLSGELKKMINLSINKDLMLKKLLLILQFEIELINKQLDLMKNDEKQKENI